MTDTGAHRPQGGLDEETRQMVIDTIRQSDDTYWIGGGDYALRSGFWPGESLLGPTAVYLPLILKSPLPALPDLHVAGVVLRGDDLAVTLGAARLNDAAHAGLGGELQTLFALTQRRICALAHNSVGEDLRHKLQPLHNLVGPRSLLLSGVETHGAKGLFASSGQRKQKNRLDPQVPPRFTVRGSLGRSLFETLQYDYLAREDFCKGPRVVLPGVEVVRNWRFVEPPVDMGHPEDTGFLRGQLPQ